MKRKIFILIFAALLSGCFGGSDNAPNEAKIIEGYKNMGNGEFNIQIPDDWIILGKNDFPDSVSGNIAAAARSNIQNNIFSPNVVIIKNALDAEINGMDYAKAVLQKNKQEIIGYNELKSEEFENSLFLYIEGRDESDSEKKRFMQFTLTKGETAYVVTGSFLANEDEGIAKKMEAIVKSFKVM